MNALTLAVALGVAFAAGFGVSRLVPPTTAAAADDPGLKAEIIDVPALAASAFSSPTPNGTPTIGYVKTPETTIGVQIGNVPKHFHADANEIQYVVSGSGTFWLGDREHEIHAGDLILIPKGTPHGGSHATDGSFKMIFIKTPPQQPGDVHLLP